MQINNPYTEFRTDFGVVTPKFSVQYQTSAASFVYAQYARGFRAGGLNVFTPTLTEISYGPEYSDNYEVGIRNTLFNNQLRLNVTAFYLQQRDQQINVIENGFFLIRNTGRLNNLGTEIEVTAQPVRGLQVLWNASTSNAEYASMTAFVQGKSRDLTGNKALFNPAFASFLAVRYRYPVREQVPVFVRGEQRYSGPIT